MDNFRSSKAFADGDGGLVIATSQDVTDIVERNKSLQQDELHRTTGVDDMHLVASIPFTVIDDLNKMGIMNGFAVVDEKAFHRWLNDPDQAAWKIYRGKL